MNITTASNGCKYIDYGAFTVVVTPHAVKRECERRFNAEKLPWYTIHSVAQHENRNQFVRVKREHFQVFVNCKYNTVRNREEVEVISVTPDDWTRKDDVCIMTLA